MRVPGCACVCLRVQVRSGARACARLSTPACAPAHACPVVTLCARCARLRSPDRVRLLRPVIYLRASVRSLRLCAGGASLRRLPVLLRGCLASFAGASLCSLCAPCAYLFCSVLPVHHSITLDSAGPPLSSSGSPLDALAYAGLSPRSLMPLGSLAAVLALLRPSLLSC